MGQDSPSNKVQIPVSTFVDDEKDIDLKELAGDVVQDMIKDRKEELSTKLNKLFYKADRLSQDERKLTNDLRKTKEKLDKTLAKIKRLREGDWTVLKELDKEDKENKEQN